MACHRWGEKARGVDVAPLKLGCVNKMLNMLLILDFR